MLVKERLDAIGGGPDHIHNWTEGRIRIIIVEMCGGEVGSLTASRQLDGQAF